MGRDAGGHGHDPGEQGNPNHDPKNGEFDAGGGSGGGGNEKYRAKTKAELKTEANNKLKKTQQALKEAQRANKIYSKGVGRETAKLQKIAAGRQPITTHASIRSLGTHVSDTGGDNGGGGGGGGLGSRSESSHPKKTKLVTIKKQAATRHATVGG